MALLETQGLSKAFGGLRAVNELDLRVELGEIVGMIGPHEAGLRRKKRELLAVTMPWVSVRP